MMKCPVCGKSKSAFEMRPIVNAEELKVGAALSEQPTEQEVAGVKVDVVCRGCWLVLLQSRSKEEIIEIMETICGILMEADNRMREKKPAFEFGEILEKNGVFFPGRQIPPLDIHNMPDVGQVIQPSPPWRSPGGNGSLIWGDTVTGIGSASDRVTLTNDFTQWMAEMTGDAGTYKAEG